MAMIAGLAACGQAQPAEPTAVLQTAYERLNKGDLDGFMTFLAADAVMLDDSGRYNGPQAIREHLQQDVIANQVRFELKNLASKGHVVTYSYDAYVGDMVVDSHDSVDVIVDGQILFDGTAQLYDFECTRDPSQAFCAAS